MSSQQFQEKLFIQRVNYEEGPLRDRKRIIRDLNNDTEKAKFVKNVMALANSARMLGKPAYLLFGIDDDGNLCGLGPSLEPFLEEARRKSHNQEWDESRFQECLWQEVIGRKMLSEVIAEYIDPQLAGKCGLKRGKIETLQLAYLLIPPIPTPKPYQVRRQLKSGKRVLLHKGQCWIRIGESKKELGPKDISPDEAPYCYAYSQVPYPLPPYWLRYFQRICSGQFYKAFHGIHGYQDLYSKAERSLRETVDEFLHNDETQLLVIQGKAGTGKSVFLRRVVYERAEGGTYEMEQNIRNERFSPPSDFIPIWVSLRGWEAESNHALDSEIMACLNSMAELWNEPPEIPERMLDSVDYRWLICLDGLDEIWSVNGQRRFISALNRFQRSHPFVKVILTTRPDVTLAGLRNEVVVELQTLTPEQVEDYLISSRASEEQHEEVIGFLKLEPGLWGLCGIPAFLEAAVTAWLDEFYPPDLENGESSDYTLETSESLAMGKPDENIETDLNEVRELVQEEIIQSEENKKELEINDEMDEEEIDRGENREEEEIIVPIRMGLVLHRIYQYIWKRERGRKLVPVGVPGKWFDETAEFAAWMDGNRSSARCKELLRFLSSEQAILWVLSLGILERTLRGGWIRFPTDLTQAYFAAIFVLPFVEEEVYEEPLAYIRQGKQPFWAKTLSLLRDLTYEDITPLEQEIRKVPS